MSRVVFLAGALGIELLALSGMAAIDDLRAHVSTFLILFGSAAAAMLVAWRLARNVNITFLTVALVALALRLPMLVTQPTLSDDVWRYLHDGRAHLARISPYAFAPADARTQSFRGSEHARINHPDLVTIYPPAAQIAFATNALFGSTLLGWRLVLMVCELALLAALLRLGATPSNLVLYAWHPLAVTEAIGSAHLEPIGIALLLAGLAAAPVSRGRAAGVLIGFSVAFKFVAAPVLLVTRHAKKPWLLATAISTIILLYAVYWTDGAVFGSLLSFASRWQANASVYGVLAALTDGHRARMLAATLLFCVIVILRRSTLPDVDRAGTFVLALLLLSPVVYPWYALWLLACVPALRESRLTAVALLWSMTIPLSYAGMIWLEYSPVYTLISLLALQHFRSRTSIPSPERILQTPI